MLFVLWSNLKYEGDKAVWHSCVNGLYLSNDKGASNCIINGAFFFFLWGMFTMAVCLVQATTLPFPACVTLRKPLVLSLNSKERNTIINTWQSSWGGEMNGRMKTCFENSKSYKTFLIDLLFWPMSPSPCLQNVGIENTRGIIQLLWGFSEILQGRCLAL